MIAFCYAISKLALWVFFRLGFGLEVTGAEHVPRAGGFVLASNHVSYFDPPLLGAACPRRLHFMARATLFQHWLLGAFMRSVGVMPLQRGQSDLPGLRLAIQRLRRGEPVAIFPEGARQPNGRLGQARRGVGLLAMQAQVPIVPVVVRGTFEALPLGARWPRRAKIRVAFGPSISYTDAPASDASTLATPDPRRPGQAGAEPAPAGAAARGRHEALANVVTHRWHRLADQLNG